jgi:hypothetical protein
MFICVVYSFAGHFDTNSFHDAWLSCFPIDECIDLRWWEPLTGSCGQPCSTPEISGEDHSSSSEMDTSKKLFQYGRSPDCESQIANLRIARLGVFMGLGNPAWFGISLLWLNGLRGSVGVVVRQGVWEIFSWEHVSGWHCKQYPKTQSNKP